MRTRDPRSFRKAGLAFAVLACASSYSAAKDLEALARFVTPAYTAMNLAAVCASRDSQFLGQTSGPRGTAFHYAEHVKNEAIESLSPEEAAIALKAAADAARAIALRTFQRLNASDPALEAQQIRSWCEAEGREMVRKFIREHDENHTAQLLELREFQH